jgi:hypothetical protein
MTARQINARGRRGEFKAQQLGSAPNKDTDRGMILDNTVEGIGKRTKPENLVDEATVNREGVHDLSASLLRGDLENKGIYEQLKKYEEAIVVFMPLPEEEDLRIFSALAKLQGMDQKTIDEMGRMLTRPMAAQASDMGTRYVDTKPGSAGEGSFKYGVTGTVIRTPGDRARKINPADMAARRKGALSYKAVATSAITRVNEVVMAYRKHESGLFPMFAKWNAKEGHFAVLRPDQSPTGNIITDKGEYK